MLLSSGWFRASPAVPCDWHWNAKDPVDIAWNPKFTKSVLSNASRILVNFFEIDSRPDLQVGPGRSIWSGICLSFYWLLILCPVFWLALGMQMKCGSHTKFSNLEIWERVLAGAQTHIHQNNSMRAFCAALVKNQSIHVISSRIRSTISSSLNAAAAITWEDLMKWRWGHLTEGQKTVILKVIGK